MSSLLCLRGSACSDLLRGAYSSLDALKARRFLRDVAVLRSHSASIQARAAAAREQKCAGFFGQLPKPGATIGIARLRVHYEHSCRILNVRDCQPEKLFLSPRASARKLPKRPRATARRGARSTDRGLPLARLPPRPVPRLASEISVSRISGCPSSERQDP